MDPIQENFSDDFETQIKNPIVISTPFELLKLYGTKTKRLHLREKDTDQKLPDPLSHKSSSATTIMKLVRSHLLQLNAQKLDVFSILSETHHFNSSFEEEIHLAMALQVSAEKVSKKKFVSAIKLLRRCQSSASKTGTPLQRIVYYFAQALQHKMDQEWGFITPNEFKEELKKPIDVQQTLNTLSPAWMACEQKFSAAVVCQYTSVQSILEDVASAKRVHLIDLGIKNGSHWTIMIQALAERRECPIELLKITAVGTSNELMKETGKSLSNFAETLNVPFLFEVVLSGLKEIKKEMFHVEVGETLAIYSSTCLWSMLPWPDDLEKLINMMKGLNPCLMVINEVNANLNSSDFIERFMETLFFMSCIFDGLMMNFNNQPCRKLIEEGIYGNRINNIITCEGRERIFRHENASFWRALFERCGFVETQLSPFALSQAKVLVDKSVAGTQIEIDGKCLNVGWNGTPVGFVSTWKICSHI